MSFDYNGLGLGGLGSGGFGNSYGGETIQKCVTNIGGGGDILM